MTFHVELETMDLLCLDYRKILEQVAMKILDMEQCPYEVEVNLILTGNNEIRELNQTYRFIDKETDVLSFPMIEFQKPSDFSNLEKGVGCFHPESGELLLGDIVLSLPKVAEQSEKFGHGILREFSFLIAHSMLHLLGYDHMRQEDADLMEKKQNLILDELQIFR
ncbi:rRNA maturation RNase YbeY [bacterium 1XD42-8]|jgi:probable rRNA maturation factor|nr:rRNA maturation RNase YbeY [Lachnospiraceae bacterium]RKJ36175.1 rRNA maturation RNase YbeY [bacterium 1XD42-8]